MMGELGYVVKFAAGSRALVIVLQFLCNHFVPDHEADAFRSPLVKLEESRWGTGDAVIHYLFEGLNRWDSQYFTHIAQFGYTYEHMVAFFPFLPWLMALVSQILQDVFGAVLCQSSWILISGVLISNVSFVLSAVVLYYLTELLFVDRHFPLKVTKLYCFNPASIFFSSCYTESLFAFLTYSGLYFLERDFDTLATIMFAASSVTRSNATLVPIFYLYKIRHRYFRGKYYFGLIMRMVLACAGNVAVQLYFWERFCFPHVRNKFPEAVHSYAKTLGYKIVGDQASEWCFNIIPFSYSYVQAKYWNVGLLKYWEMKQMPNFVLALPIIVLISHFCRGEHRRRLQRYCVHAVILSCIFVFFANVQVATRVIMSASPLPFWAAASAKNPTLLWAYFIWYFFAGIFLHSNFLPWT